MSTEQMIRTLNTIKENNVKAVLFTPGGTFIGKVVSFTQSDQLGNYVTLEDPTVLSFGQKLNGLNQIEISLDQIVGISFTEKSF